MNWYINIKTSQKRGGRLVVVDVQPAYASYIGFDMHEFTKFMSGYSSILILFNGPEMGYEGQNEISEFYYENGLNERNLGKLSFFEKGYAFFRDSMDACWARNDIVKLVKYMIQKGYTDIRELKKEDIEYLNIEEVTMDTLENHGFYIPDLKDTLASWSGADICGGGLNECLEEVKILSEAMGLTFNNISKFIY